MAVDREDVLKKAEKLLRQGKLGGAIEEYVRLVEDQPRDWNSVNALGDLYVRAGDTGSAITQFIHVADGLFTEGFLARAAAVYKKALKLNRDHEHALMQLAEIAVRQGLLADAKSYFRQVADQRRRRGDERGAAECLIRLGTLEEADVESLMAAARAAQLTGDGPQAAALLVRAADDLEKQGRQEEALDALVEAIGLDTANSELRARVAHECVRTGQLERVRPFLTLEAVGNDTDLLLALAQLELASNNEPTARAILTRILTIEPGRHPDVMKIALGLAQKGRPESASDCIDIVVDAALLDGDWNGAVSALHAFVREVPHIPALLKLVELCVDAGLDAPLRDAQAQLADAYLDAGMAAEARFISQDLLDHDPGCEAHAQRLRRAQALLGISAADGLSGSGTDQGETGLPSFEEVPEPLEDPGDERPVPQNLEVDLSDVLSGIIRMTPAGSPPGAPQRENPGSEPLQDGTSDAIAELRAAADNPATSAKASAQLGRLYVKRGELEAGIEWLERAADSPTASQEEGFAVLYDLADALARAGESARAMAVLIDLDADAGGYRDVRARIEDLARAQAGSHGN